MTTTTLKDLIEHHEKQVCLYAGWADAETTEERPNEEQIAAHLEAAERHAAWVAELRLFHNSLEICLPTLGRPFFGRPLNPAHAR